MDYNNQTNLTEKQEQQTVLQGQTDASVQTQEERQKRYQRPKQPRVLTAQQRRQRTLFLVQMALLVAIEAIFCFTPLGSLPAIGPIVMTLAMIPVVISAILFGTGVGPLMGLVAGIFSLIVWTFMPPNPVTAFVFSPFAGSGELQGNFWSLVICIVPRVLTGTVAGLVYRGINACVERNRAKHPDAKPSRWKNILACAVGGAAGSLTNTLLVLGGIYLFFGQAYAQALETAYSLLLLIIGGTILSNGIPEAVLSALCSAAVCVPLKKLLNRKRREAEA